MFSKIVVLILIVGGGILWVLAGQQMNGSDGQIACYIFSVAFWLVAIIWFILMTAGTYTCQLQDFIRIKEIKSEIKLYKERKDNLAGIVKTELAKYPEYEQKIIGDIKPEFLLQFPDLKSNQTITTMVSGILKLEDSVYNLRNSLIGTQRKILYRETSPWVIYVTPYQKFFGEKNPLDEVKD